MKSVKAPDNFFTVAPGVWGMKDVFVNFYMIQDAASSDWFLVDAGLKWSYSKIKQMAAYLFTEESKPKGIVLTHGHFDHVGSVRRLADEWDVPVYAHHLEIPFLTGQSDYPPADSSVGGGMMASMAFLYPVTPINIWRHIHVLPSDGTIPGLPEWRYLHTPGHTPGHISLFRDSDKVLIAGDAFVTTKSEAVTAIMMQKKIISGPPKYLTCDWHSAKFSVEELCSLKPEIAATGHGKPMQGHELQKELTHLVKNFYKDAVPSQGRYVPYPAITNENGVLFVPPKKPTSNEKALTAFGVAALVALGFVWNASRLRKRQIAYDSLMDVEYNY